MRTTRKNRLAATAALAALACGINACSGSSSSPSNTSADGGASAAPAADTNGLTLTIGTDDHETAPSAEQINHFVREVATLSEGAISVEPVWHAAGDQAHWDQAVAQMLLDGQLDMAMIPSRAWDDLGVTSLTALTAPFLVTTDTLVSQVVSDPRLVEQLTSGLPSVGVTALGLYPEGLRHPFGLREPLLGVRDYQGGIVRAPWSRTVDSTFEALGATTEDADLDPSTMIGSESSYRLSPAGTATGNVVFYPKVNVLALSADKSEGLTEEQRAVLQEAADATATWVQQILPSDAESARTFCEEAGRIAAATPAQLASLVKATRGVVESLREDPTTDALIDAISSMAADDPDPERVTSCPETVADRASELNGVYTFTATEKAIRAAGGTDQGKIDENTGDFTLEVENGAMLVEQVYSQGPKAGTVWHGAWTYSFDGKVLKIYYSHEPGDWTTMRVKARRDGSLVFSRVRDGDGPEEQALSDVWYATWQKQAD